MGWRAIGADPGQQLGTAGDSGERHMARPHDQTARRGTAAEPCREARGTGPRGQLRTHNTSEKKEQKIPVEFLLQQTLEKSNPNEKMQQQTVWKTITYKHDEDKDRQELKKDFLENVDKYWVLICVNLFEDYAVHFNDSKKRFFEDLAEDGRYNSIQKYRSMWSKLK